MSKGWEMVKLGEEFDLQMGKTPDRKNDTYWNTGDNLWVSIADMSNCSSKYIVSTKETISDDATINMKQVPKGIVIMSFKLSIGKVSITDANLYTNEAIMAFLPRNNYYADFLYYRLLSFAWTEGLNKAVKGITLNKASISNTKMLFPSFEQQKRIVATLDKASELIALRKKQLEELDALAESVFYDMFGDPVKNEKGWKVFVLDSICTNIVDCPHSTPIKTNDVTKYPCIRTSELKNGEIEWKSMQYLEENEYTKRVKRLAPQENDIIYGREGTYGDAVCLPKGYNFSLGQRTMLLRPNTTTVHPKYLLYIIISDHVYNQAKKKNSGSTVGHVNVKDIKKFNIIVPPLLLQTQFATIIEKIEQQKSLARKALQESEDLFQRLMQDLFKPD